MLRLLPIVSEQTHEGWLVQLTDGDRELAKDSHTMASVNLEKTVEGYGYPYPDDLGREMWRKSSVALNAARVTTTLLIQSPESEALASLETFKALRHHRVPVEVVRLLE
jgi:hypothetical protein